MRSERPGEGQTTKGLSCHPEKSGLDSVGSGDPLQALGLALWLSWLPLPGRDRPFMVGCGEPHSHLADLLATQGWHPRTNPDNLMS